MSVEKSEVKVHTANDIGVAIEDLLEQAQRAEKMHEGAKLILAEAIKNVGLLPEHLERDITEGKVKLDELGSLEAISGLVRKYLGHVQNMLENMRLGSQNAAIGSAAMAVAYQKSMGVAQRVRDTEKSKIDAVAKIEGTPEGEDVDLRRTKSRVDGQHPGNPLAARREVKPEAQGSAKKVGPSGVKATKPPGKGKGRV